MPVRISKIVEDVAALLGESLALECEPEESLLPDLALRVALLSPGLLARILEETPVARLSGWKPLSGSISVESETGILPLPDDFFILGPLKAEGWKKTLIELSPPDGAQAAMQASKWKGIRATPENPFATIGVTFSGGRALRMSPWKTGERLEEGWYIPMPRIQNDALEVADDLYPLLLDKLKSVFLLNSI